MDLVKYKTKILQHKRRSDEIIEAIKHKTFKTPDCLHSYIYPFVLNKYSLSETEDNGYSLKNLAENSVARAVNLGINEIEGMDSSATCEGTTSSMKKKVLLLITIQRELNIRFPTEITASIETTMDLSDAVFNELLKVMK